MLNDFFYKTFFKCLVQLEIFSIQKNYILKINFILFVLLKFKKIVIKAVKDLTYF